MDDKKTDLTTFLASTRQELIDLVQSVDADQIDRPPAEGKWSLRPARAQLTVLEPQLPATAG